MNRINTNISNMHQSSVSGLNTELSALRHHGSRRGQIRRNNFCLYLSFCTGPLRSRMGSRCPCISEAVIRVGFGDHSLQGGVSETVALPVAGADWRPPHLCGGVMASCEVLLAGLCRPCRLAGWGSSVQETIKQWMATAWSSGHTHRDFP